MNQQGLSAAGTVRSFYGADIYALIAADTFVFINLRIVKAFGIPNHVYCGLGTDCAAGSATAAIFPVRVKNRWRLFQYVGITHTDISLFSLNAMGEIPKSNFLPVSPYIFAPKKGEGRTLCPFAIDLLIGHITLDIPHKVCPIGI